MMWIVKKELKVKPEIKRRIYQVETPSSLKELIIRPMRIADTKGMLYPTAGKIAWYMKVPSSDFIRALRKEGEEDLDYFSH